MQKIHADRLYEAGCHPQTHAIIAAMLGRQPRTTARYVGKATITSDGFVMCNFIGGDGDSHMGAFVASFDQIEENLQLVAEDLSIPEDQTGRLLWSWIAEDYRCRPMTGLLPKPVEVSNDPR